MKRILIAPCSTVETVTATHEPHERDVTGHYASCRQESASPTSSLQTDCLIHQLLPEEIQLNVFRLLDIPDLAVVSQVCHTWHALATDYTLWPVESLTSNMADGPSHRVCHTATQVDSERVILYGGHCPLPESNYINDVNSEVWEYNIKSGQFRQCTPTEFHSRTEHAALAYKGKVIIIGGYAGALGYTSTLLQFDPDTSELTEIQNQSTTSPPTRSALCAGVWKEEIYVFSGWNGTTSNDDFYKFNMNTKQWEVVVFGGLRPPPRRSACYVQYKNAMYIWGGYGVDEHVSSDVWKFDFELERWSIVQTRGNPPSVRSRARAVMIHDRMVIIGGWDRERHFQDWFELNLETNEWSERQVELPFPIGQHAMVSAKNMIVLFGGFDARTGSASNVLFTHKLGHLYHTASGGGN